MIRLHRRGAGVLGVCVWLLTLAAWVFSAHPTELVDSYAKCADEGYPITYTEPPTCSAFGRTFLGPRDAATPSPSTPAGGPAGTAQPFEILVEGDSGGAYPNRQEVITNPPAWQHYWGAVHGHLKTLPPLLSIDFIKNDVVALSEGQKTTGGYGLKVTTITSGPKGTIVDATETVPTITCTATKSITNRYFIVKTSKLTPPVSFRLTTDYHHCG
jgi:hypothetical protein